jgi:hypothetical protein
MKNMENMEEKHFCFFYKTINTACNLFTELYFIPPHIELCPLLQC